MNIKNKSKNIIDFDEHLLNELKDETFAQEYFGSILEDFRKNNDVDFFIHCLKPIIEAQGSVSKFASEIGISRTYLYKIFNNKVKPEFETLTKIFKGLGFEICLNIKKIA